MDWKIKKDDVYKEVAKSAAYVAAKMDDEAAYERINIVEENYEMLERAWEECKDFICINLGRCFAQAKEENGEFILTLDVSMAFDKNLRSPIERTLFSLFVKYIVAKWFEITNKADMELYAAESTALMKNVKRMVYYKKKPLILV